MEFNFKNGFILGFSIAATVSAITIVTLLPNDSKVLQLREYLPNEFNSTNPYR